MADSWDLGNKESYDSHIQERTEWKDWMKDRFFAYMREVYGDDSKQVARMHEYEVRYMDFNEVTFEAYMHGDTVWIDLPTLYAFDPEAWRVEEQRRQHEQELREAEEKARKEAALRDQRHRMYLRLKEEFDD